MKKHSRLITRVTGILLAALLFAAGCASKPAAVTPDPFVEANRATFTVTQLDNGIPLIIKQNPGSRIVSFKVGFKAPTLYTPANQAGLEAMTLGMLSRGSQDYSWEDIQTIAYLKSSAIGADWTNFDFTSFDLTTLDKYTGELLDVWLSCLLKPSWDPEMFEQLKGELLLARQNKEEDPYSKASIILNKSFFGKQPYATDLDGTLMSLAALNLEDIKTHYARLLSTNRMFIVVVGNVDAEAIKAQLNGKLGSISTKAAPLYTLNDADRAPGGTVLIEPFEQSKGVAYVRGNFNLPRPGTDEFTAVSIASDMLSDIFFDVIRTQNGAAYSVWAKPYSFTSNYGCFAVYKTNVPHLVKPWIDTAVGILTSGRTMAAKVEAGVKNIDGSADEEEAPSALVPISDSIGFYKDKFVTTFFEGQQTGPSIASQIASSYILTGDPLYYLELRSRLARVSEGDIIDAARTYFAESAKSWIILGSSDVLGSVQAEQFK